VNDQLRSAISESLQAWSDGRQDQAIDAIRPFADAEEPAALGLICWYLHQRGESGIREGVPYAKRAAAVGLPWPAQYLLGNMIGDPQLREEVPSLVEALLAIGWTQVDPIGYAISPFQQGDRATALQIFDLIGPWPFPGQWTEHVESGRRAIESLRSIAGEAQEELGQFHELITSASGDVDSERSRVSTQAGSVLELLKQAADGTIKAEFDREAATNATESRRLWLFGLTVLGGAALLAVLPLILHYFSLNTLEGRDLLAAHFAPTVALGAVAGVLLGRAKARDRSRQRARDLSVALGTMVVYSGQIDDAQERQAFQREMGKAILEAHLRTEAVGEESTNVLASLIGK
jgi:hypothetical protein